MDEKRVVLGWEVTESMDAVSARADVVYSGRLSLREVPLFTLSAGYVRADGADEIRNVFSAAFVDSAEQVLGTGDDGQPLVATKVVARDLGRAVTDTICLVQFLASDVYPLPLRQPLDFKSPPAGPNQNLPKVPAGWTRVVSKALTARRAADAVLSPAGFGGRKLVWLVDDYPILYNFTGRGHVIDVLRTLLAPMSLLEVTRPYVWYRAQDSVLVVAPLGSGAGASWVFDAAAPVGHPTALGLDGDITVSETWGPQYGHWLVTGAPDLKFFDEVTQPSVTISHAASFDEEGATTSESWSMSRTRGEDQALVFSSSNTWEPDESGNLAETSYEETVYTWEAAAVDRRTGSILNRPMLLLSQQTRQELVDTDFGKEMRIVERSSTFYRYNVFKVLDSNVTLTQQIDPDTGKTTGSSSNSTFYLSATRAGVLTWRSTLAAGALSAQSALSGGLPAGGAGSGPQLPAVVAEGAGDGWVDLEYSNQNLSSAFVGSLVGAIPGASGKVLREVRFRMVAKLGLHRGDVVEIRNVQVPGDAPATFGGQVVNLVTRYSESPMRFTQDVTLRRWV